MMKMNRLVALVCLLVSGSAVAGPGIPSRIEGSIYGLAYGDAKGAITETWTHAQISQVYGTLQAIPEVHPFETIKRVVGEKAVARIRVPGAWTDDTQQGLALLIVAGGDGNRTWDDSKNTLWADTLVEGFKVEAWRGFGKMFKAAVDSYGSGTSFRQSGTPSAGIGAAMRTAPLGALFYDQPEVLVKAAIESSLITHGDARAAALATALPWVVAQFINGKSVTEIRAELADQVLSFENQIAAMAADATNPWKVDLTGLHDLSNSLRTLMSQEAFTLDEISRQVTELAGPLMGKNPSELNANNPFVLLGGLHALGFALMENLPNPMAAIDYIAVFGDDTDTVAAMAGSMLGARFGSNWIPLDQLKDRARAEGFAKMLSNRSSAPEKLSQFLALEHDALERERAFQKVNCDLYLEKTADSKPKE